MRWISILLIFLLFPSISAAAPVQCDTFDDMVICYDNNDFAYVYRDGQGTLVVNTNTWDYVDMVTSQQGNLYANQPQPTQGKKKNFWDKLGQFGRALEDGFDNDNDAVFDNDLSEQDPLCVTQLQRRTNKCDD